MREKLFQSLFGVLEFYQQPIIEGLVVSKAGNERRAFLAQIAYDIIPLVGNI
jgi:hypothetical protein